MADSPAEAPVSSGASATPPAAIPEVLESAEAATPADGGNTAEALLGQHVTIRELLEAGVHFGHQTRRWNPRMKPYLFGERNGVHIVDLDKTLPRIREALTFVTEVVARGGKVLFVGTKRQAQAPIRLEAERCHQYFVNNRWLGGMLTNFKTVKKSIERYKTLLEIVGDEEKSAEQSKKELARINRQVEKYRKSLDGIQEMARLPNAVFIIDVRCEMIAVSEAQRLGIPIIGVVDSNSDPNGIDFMIPGNDDSLRAIQLYCSRIANACLEGDAIHNERVQAEEAQRAKSKSPEKRRTDEPSTGRVVVEIKHPPRRGRGAALAAERREAERDTVETEKGGEKKDAATESAAEVEKPEPPDAS